MKIFEEINNYKKEYVFDICTRIIEDFKDYEKITKKTMIKKIYEVYQNPKDLIDICTFRELKFLKLYLEKDKEKNIKRNKKFLTEFKAYMKNQKLSPKTIKNILITWNYT